MKLTQRSEENLIGVKEELTKVVRACAETFDKAYPNLTFVVTDGLRTIEEQKKLVAEGKSKTMNSRHLLGEAVDVAVLLNGKITWDFKYYKIFADEFKKTAEKLNIKIEWGGDWASFKDGPHFQLKK